MDVEAKLKQEKGVRERAKRGREERERERERVRDRHGGREIVFLYFFFGLGGREMKSWRPTLDFL